MVSVAPPRKVEREGEAGARLSSDGVALVRAVASPLGIAPPHLPRENGRGLVQAIEAHIPLYKEYVPTAGLLAKTCAWDECEGRRAQRFNRAAFLEVTDVIALRTIVRG